MKKMLTLILIAGVFMPVLIEAQEKKGKSAEEQFKFLDKNSDGNVSKEEFLAPTPDARKGKRGMRFDEADKDKDGFLSFEEYKEVPGVKTNN